jgi:anti-sigma factor RsiW
MIGIGKPVRVRCFLLRPTLVSFADGMLPEPARSDVERHLAGCSGCTEDVVALREVPALLRRRTAPAPDERFWARQRESIARAVQAAPAPRAAARGGELRWLVPAAAAAALLLVVRLWRPTESVVPATAPVTAVPAGEETMVTAMDEPGPVVPEDVPTLDETTIANLGESLDEEIGGLSDAGLI